MVLVPAGIFNMGDGISNCGVDDREVTLTRDFHLGQHEVTNQKYLESVQWAYDQGHVTATTLTVQDNLDGSVEELLDLDSEWCEISFNAGIFSLRDAGQGINPNNPVMEVTWYGAARYGSVPNVVEKSFGVASTCTDDTGAVSLEKGILLQ